MFVISQVLCIFLCGLHLSSARIPSRFWFRLQNAVSDEFRYRKSSFQQYRQQIEVFWNQSIDSFRSGQMKRSGALARELDDYKRRLDDAYNNIAELLSSQREYLQELNKLMTRPKQFDQSLQDFRRLYNETLYQKFLSPTPSLQRSFPWNASEVLQQHVETFTGQLKTNWDSVLQVTKETRKLTEESIKETLKDFASIQDSLMNKLNTSAHELWHSADILSKGDLRRRRREWEDQLHKLEREGTQWIEDRLKQLDTTFRGFQERIRTSDFVFEELVSKRKSSLHHTVMNDMTLSKALKLIDANDPGWTLIRSEDGFDVYRKFTGKESHFACVKCAGVVKADPVKVFALFEDEKRVKEYNSFFDTGMMLEAVGDNTKIVWASATPIFPFKARDFCTVIHWRKLKDGTLVFLNRGTKHPKAPPTSKFVRGNVLLSANIVQPIPGQPNKCHLTMITQVDPGGFAPPMIINQLCALGPIGFMKNVEKSANRELPWAYMEEKRRLLSSKTK